MLTELAEGFKWTGDKIPPFPGKLSQFLGYHRRPLDQSVHRVHGYRGQSEPSGANLWRPKEVEAESVEASYASGRLPEALGAKPAA